MGSRYDNLSNPLLELAAREHHAPAAGQAADADIGTDANHLPLVPSAGVRLAHTHFIADLDF